LPSEGTQLHPDEDPTSIHSVQSNVPTENILAVFRALKDKARQEFDAKP
jgi:hypothetical protein